MEIDKSVLTHDVARELWANMDPFGEQAPFDEQNAMVQYNLKAQVLPVVNLTIPHAERMLKEKLIRIIEQGREDKLTDEEILLALNFELS